ncbi:MAG: MarC family protein [Candidatus Omnitrophica bacterium]|nr:MarC family protein [Candidatus Omnitrophota bacterium]
MMRTLLLAFIPIFVAVDAIGVLPIFVTLTEGIGLKERLRVIVQSMITALCLAVGFIFLGRAVFGFLNITIGDFMVAGGAILFCIAIIDIVNPDKRRRKTQELGAVPLGTPLIVGPAVLTTSLIIISEYGVGPAIFSVSANILLAGIIFSCSEFLIHVLGVAGTKALSKVMSLLLAAIAVMMVRKGIMAIFFQS